MPILLTERAELDSKKQSLLDEDRSMRNTNRQLLVEGIDTESLGSRSQWEAITRLQGPRARRLREFLDKGSELGLFGPRRPARVDDESGRGEPPPATPVGPF